MNTEQQMAVARAYVTARQNGMATVLPRRRQIAPPQVDEVPSGSADGAAIGRGAQ